MTFVLEPIYAPARGKVQWKRSHGERVGPGELLGVVIGRDGERWEIRSPAIGTLLILPKGIWEVGAGEPIAYLKLASIVV